MMRRSFTSSILLPCMLVWSTTAWAQGPATATAAPPEVAEQPAVESEAPTNPDPAAEGVVAETTEGTTSDGTTPAGYPVAEPEPAPAEPAAEELPAYDAALPTYDVAPPAQPIDEGGKPQLRYAPKDGRGLISLGGVLTGGGTVLTAVSIGLIAANEDVPVWIAGSVIGGLAIAGGVAMLVGGKKRLKSYQTWEADLGEPVPRQGSGLRAAGMISMIGGGFGAAMGGVSLLLQDDEDPPYGQVLLGLGLSSGVAGIVMVSLGVRREREFKSWRRGESTTLVPTVGGLRGGATIGVAGRF